MRRRREPILSPRTAKVTGIVSFLAVVGLMQVGLNYQFHNRTKPLQKQYAEEVGTHLIERKVEVTELIEWPTGRENAADYYVQAFKPFDNLKAREEGFEVRDADLLEPESPEILLIIEGAQHAESRMSPEYYQLYTDNNVMLPPFHSIKAFARVLAQRATKYLHRSFTEFESAAKDAALAEAYRTAKAMVVWGRHMADERLSMKQLLIGEEICNMGAEQLRKIAMREGDDERAELLRRYIIDGARLRGEVERKQSYLVPLKEEYVDAIIKVAREDEDVIFRALAYFILEENRNAFFHGSTEKRMEAALESIDPTEFVVTPS